MRTKYKTILILSTICLVVTGIVILSNTKQTAEITTVKLQGFTKDFSLGTIQVKSYSDNGRNGVSFVPANVAKMETAILENAYYVSEKVMNIEGLERNGWFFCKDNNIYFLYESTDEEYTLINVYSDYETIENKIISFPSLARINFTSMSFEMAEEGDYDLLSLIFDNYDYSKAKEIYGLFDASSVSFKEAEQQIWIRGYNEIENDESISVWIVLDFLNEKIGHVDAEGTIIYLE